MAAAPAFLEIADWGKLQHYKDRRPPWIRLHNSLLDDPRWGRLDEEAKATLIVLFLLASRTENRIPSDPVWIQRLGGLHCKPRLASLLECGLVQYASNPLATCSPEESREEESRDRAEERESPAPPVPPPSLQAKGGKPSREDVADAFDARIQLQAIPGLRSAVLEWYDALRGTSPSLKTSKVWNSPAALGRHLDRLAGEPARALRAVELCRDERWTDSGAGFERLYRSERSGGTNGHRPPTTARERLEAMVRENTPALPEREAPRTVEDLRETA